MLYVTTRDHKNIHTARHPLCKDRDGAGGLYIPFRPVVFPPVTSDSLKERNFGQWIAEFLNRFFGTKLNGWDVDFCIGRHPFRLVPMSHRILIAETWNNPDNTVFWIAKKLKELILPESAKEEDFSDWLMVVIRTGILFGIFSELSRLDLIGQNRTLDVSVSAGDFSGPIAAFYARDLGLPIGKIIFGCNDNSGAWDLIHHGELHANAPLVHTDTPECDHSVPRDLERLIYARFGLDETIRFGERVSGNRVYTLPEEKLSVLNSGFFGAVISKRRMESVIRNVFRTNQYLLGPYSALAFGALQDYRATNSEAGPALIITEHGPQQNEETVSRSLGDRL